MHLASFPNETLGCMSSGRSQSKMAAKLSLLFCHPNKVCIYLYQDLTIYLIETKPTWNNKHQMDVKNKVQNGYSFAKVKVTAKVKSQILCVKTVSGKYKFNYFEHSLLIWSDFYTFIKPYIYSLILFVKYWNSLCYNT